MLRASALDLGGNWDKQVPLMEFAYNNGYHASIEMAPFEALYGRKCRTPICWDEVGERKLLGPELVQITTDNLQVVRANLKTAQDRQKSYANLKRTRGESRGSYPLDSPDRSHIPRPSSCSVGSITFN